MIRLYKNQILKNKHRIFKIRNKINSIIKIKNCKLNKFCKFKALLRKSCKILNQCKIKFKLKINLCFNKQKKYRHKTILKPKKKKMKNLMIMKLKKFLSKKPE